MGRHGHVFAQHEFSTPEPKLSNPKQEAQNKWLQNNPWGGTGSNSWGGTGMHSPNTIAQRSPNFPPAVPGRSIRPAHIQVSRVVHLGQSIVTPHVAGGISRLGFRMV